jgi:hypothetical protein
VTWCGGTQLLQSHSTILSNYLHHSGLNGGRGGGGGLSPILCLNTGSAEVSCLAVTSKGLNMGGGRVGVEGGWV